MLMRVVMQNLLGNGWKYSATAERPRIAFSHTWHCEGFQEFCARDNGAGFDMAYVQQLFRPLKRLHTPERFEGFGVGPAMVLLVGQRHGGGTGRRCGWAGRCVLFQHVRCGRRAGPYSTH